MAESIRIDVKEHQSESKKADHIDQKVKTDSKKADHINQKVTTFERIFVISNFILELPSAVFDQLSSPKKAQYALLSMLISFTVLIISITDLVYKGRKERATWMKRGLIPWFYYSYPNSKPFGTFPDIIGLVCAFLQFIFATIAYAFLTKHADNPIKVSVWPIIFAFGLLYSTLLGHSQQRKPNPLVRRLHRAEEFTLAELAAASNNFSPQNKIGVGSFSAVYRGKLSDGRQVAIKRVETAQQRIKFEEEQSAFESELTFLSRLHHKHLVRLFGYCEQHDEIILVYEYLNNGCLCEHLQGKMKHSSVINSWKMRIKIALEAARGIEYLHNYAIPPIIHRNIKSSNILLDSNWTVRVSMTGPEFEHGYRSMEAAGTNGYTDPEYYSRNVLTAKSDVYSLGVVFLELLTGKKPIFKDDDRGGLPISIVDFAVPKILANELVKVLDHRVGPPKLGNEAKAVEIVAYTALHCVNAKGSNRPTIKNIVANLDQASSLCDETMEDYQQRENAEQLHSRSDQMESRLSTNEIKRHQL